MEKNSMQSQRIGMGNKTNVITEHTNRWEWGWVKYSGMGWGRKQWWRRLEIMEKWQDGLGMGTEYFSVSSYNV